MAFRRNADALMLGPVCNVKAKHMDPCLKQIMPSDPPAVVFLNKIFEFLEGKLKRVNACRDRVALLFAPAPHLRDYEAIAGVPARFLPYGAELKFGMSANRDGRPVAKYYSDIGFSGSLNRYAPRYHLRSATLGNATVRARLTARGVKIYTPGFVPLARYIQLLEASKVWFATTEAGDHASTRYFEVLISGRAMLLCNRNPMAYAPLGLVEGVHAAMYNTTEEFEEKLLYYLHHEEERLAIVRAARKHVLAKHLWSHRAAETVTRVRDALAAYPARRKLCGFRGSCGLRDPTSIWVR